MRAQIIALAAAAATVIPAAALAQDSRIRNLDAELRAREAQQNLRTFEQQQRQPDLDARTTDLDLRLRTQQNLNSLGPATPTYQPMDASPIRNVPAVIDFKLQSEVAAAELSAGNERLRERNPR